MYNDLKFALRQMLKNPGFTSVAVLSLALGIGLNTAIFSVAYGVLWRPLPYAQPDRLVVLSSAVPTEKGPKTFWTWAPATYEALRPQVTSLDPLAAYDSIDVQLTGHGEPQQVHALDVSPNFFTTLGVQPVRGRGFLTGSAASDDDRTVIVSDRLWRASLNADPAIIGRSITVDGVPRTVIGVLPPTFSFRPVIRIGALPEAELFLPNRWPGDNGRDAFLFLLGRLKPGVTRERVEVELTPLLSNPAIVPAGALAPEGVIAPNIHARARVIGMQEHGTESVRRLLLVLLGAVSVVLLIACGNVANLQMARFTARRGELSVRLALGAASRRIVRQLLTEALALSLLGGALGALLAWWAVHLTLPLVPPFALPRVGGIVFDARLWGFCLGLSLLTTVLIGLVPALRIGGPAGGGTLALHAAQSRTTADRHGERLRTLLVAGQIALTLVLLIGAGLLLRSFLRLTSVSPGFALNGPDGVLQTVKVTLPERLFDQPERIHAFARGVLERVQHLPGVKSASLINSLPFGMMFIQDEFDIDGQPRPALFAGVPKIDADYFRTMGIPLLAGRDFGAQDGAGAPKVAIISERVAREFSARSPGEALGRRVRLGDGSDWLTVVGVVADIRQMGLDREVQPMIYVPFLQDRSGFLRFVAFVARTTSPAGVVEGIRAEIRRAAPDLPIESAVTMNEAVAASVAPPGFRTLVLLLFAVTALLIATCGLYGLMAYAVTQRRREIGVRLALGAERGDVLRLVLRRALRVVLTGLGLGLVGAVVVTRVLRAFLFGVTPTDPVTFLAVALLLVAVGLLAAWLPARRAAKLDPVVALRTD